MDAQRETMDRFLVDTFHSILRLEQKSLESYSGGLTVNEFHLVEAVIRAGEESQNTMKEIAVRMSVTMGTLTTAAKTLERKGFLRRERTDRDRRVVRLAATDEGRRANLYHRAFHTEMVDSVMGALSKEQLFCLTEALKALIGHFGALEHNRTKIKVEGES